MQPNEIRNLAQSSQWIDSLRPRGSSEAFILAWISWEGLKNRLLTYCFAKQGYLAKDTVKALRVCNVHSKAQYLAIFELAFGKHPLQVSNLGPVWREIESFRPMRNRIIHGGTGAKPEDLLRASRTISTHVLNTGWLEGAKIQINGFNFVLGSPYKRIIANRNPLRSYEELLTTFRSGLEHVN